jgi:hypothetical protein
LADEFSINRETVSLIFRRLGVAIRHRSVGSKQVAQASKLYAEGLSLMRVAERLGVTQGAVNNALKAAGVELRRRPGWVYRGGWELEKGSSTLTMRVLKSSCHRR